MKKLALLLMILTSCTHNSGQNTDQQATIPPSDIVGTWEVTTNAESTLGAITFNEDGTFLTELYDSESDEPLLGLFESDNNYLKPETLNLIYKVGVNDVLTLRYYGKTSTANEFEVFEFPLTVTQIEPDLITVTYVSEEETASYDLVRQ